MEQDRLSTAPYVVLASIITLVNTHPTLAAWNQSRTHQQCRQSVSRNQLFLDPTAEHGHHASSSKRSGQLIAKAPSTSKTGDTAPTSNKNPASKANEPTTPPSQATTVDQQSARAEARKAAFDELTRAFEDELTRTESRLSLPGHPLPYFTAYLSKDIEQFNVYGCFGALDKRDHDHSRSLNVDVRIGDYKFDSSGGKLAAIFQLQGAQEASLDNDYDALRHQLWLRSDHAYKHAVEAMESKKALLQQKKIDDLPESMSKAAPLISIQPAVQLDINKEYWEQAVRNVSAAFKRYPAVINSEVAFISRARTRAFANSEGSLNREGDRGLILGMTATAQSSDGMQVQDFEMFGGQQERQLPDLAELEKAANKLAERVTLLAQAPIVETYRGPILLEKQAAAEFFAQTLAPNLVASHEPILAQLSFGKSNPEERLDRRILPAFISVVDDPCASEFHGTPLKGGYSVDDEGVKAKKLTLVEGGVLKTLCCGRTPGRHLKESNGHCRDGVSSVSQLFITATGAISLENLRQKLIQLGKEQGLKHVYIARRISTLYLQFLDTSTPDLARMLSAQFGHAELNLASPTMLFRVSVEDGKEELVRGAKFDHLTQRLWRDIEAAADDSQPYLVLPAVLGCTTASSLVTPSILISEIEIGRESHETDTPMLLKKPLLDR